MKCLKNSWQLIHIRSPNNLAAPIFIRASTVKWKKENNVVMYVCKGENCVSLCCSCCTFRDLERKFTYMESNDRGPRKPIAECNLSGRRSNRDRVNKSIVVDSCQTSRCFDGCCTMNGSLHIRRKSPCENR